MVIEPLPAAVSPVAVDEVKAFLRLTGSDDDALLAGFIRAATALAEAFTAQRLIARDFTERLTASAQWQRLHGTPVVAITGVTGDAGLLTGDGYETDIDLDGNGWVRVVNPSTIGSVVAAALDADPPWDGPRMAVHPQPRVTVTFRAGLAADWNGVPEPIRQGIVRLTAHFYTHRDAADAGPPPAAVAALWRPWRRLRLH